MNLGFVSAILADRSFNEVIDFASENKFSCVELMCWPKGKAERRYAGVTHIDVNDYDVQKIKESISSRGISISGLGYYPNPLDADLEKREVYVSHLKKLISAAKELDISVVNTFIGRNHTSSIDDNFAEFRKVWPDLVKCAEDNGIKIAIENCPMFFTQDEWPGGQNLASTPAIWRRMFEEIDSDSFGLNYDPSHLVWQQMDYVKPVYEFKEKLFHVHFKDAKVYDDKLNDVGIMAVPLDYHSPKLPGLGDVQWGKFISALTDVGYNGDACIEVEDKAFEGSPEAIELSLIQSRDFLSQYVPLRK
ncbi:MAG: sugar phosphate isomerase/epimerase [Lentisphaeria bacterium]|nr:sugar phosphate isomerase/epimerase [Lentisphaeria bacterium]NQZ68618.1 sugar phosphate isomerase/epimerase [Lentisphaeria bacterium]